MADEPKFTREEVLAMFNFQRRVYTAPLISLSEAELIETIEESEKSFVQTLNEAYMRKRMHPTLEDMPIWISV